MAHRKIKIVPVGSRRIGQRDLYPLRREILLRRGMPGSSPVKAHQQSHIVKECILRLDRLPVDADFQHHVPADFFHAPVQVSQLRRHTVQRPLLYSGLRLSSRRDRNRNRLQRNIIKVICIPDDLVPDIIGSHVGSGGDGCGIRLCSFGHGAQGVLHRTARSCPRCYEFLRRTGVSKCLRCWSRLYDCRILL